MLNGSVVLWSVFKAESSKRFDMSQLDVKCTRDFSDEVLPVEL